MRKNTDDFVIGVAHLYKARNKRAFKHVDYPAGAVGVPQDPVSPIREITLGAWQIYWQRRRGIESGKLEVDFIVRTPHSAPGVPHRTKVMEIFGGVCNHIEGVPKFVSATADWRYWVLSLSAEKCIIKPLLLGPTTACGCDPWLDARTSGQVYEALCEWLKRLDKTA